MNPVSLDIKDLLESEFDLGLRFGSNLFVGREPTTPNEVVTLYDTGGLPPMQTLTKGENYYYDSFQVRVRAESYLRAYEIIDSIMNFLHGTTQQTINTTLYSIITCSNGPALLEWDENNRVLFICNFTTQRREA